MARSEILSDTEKSEGRLDKCYLTKWDDKTKSVAMVYGYAKTFEEEYEEITNNEQ